MRHTIPILTAVLMASDRLDAQSAPTPLPPTVPTALALALAAGFGDMMVDPLRVDGPLLVLGATPAGFPRGLVPRDARLVAGVRGANAPTAIVAVDGEAPAALERVHAFLEREGWRPAPPMPQLEGMVFMTSGPSMHEHYRCKGDSAVLVSATPVPESVERGAAGPVSYVSLAYLGDGSFICNPQRLRDRESPLRIPPLPPPPGAVGGLSGAGSSGGESSASEHADGVLRTELPADAVAAHYAAALAQAGWEVGAAVRAGASTVVPLQASDRKRRPWRGTLTVTDHAPRIRLLFLQMAFAEAR